MGMKKRPTLQRRTQKERDLQMNYNTKREKVNSGGIAAIAAVIAMVLGNEYVTLVLLAIGGVALLGWLVGEILKEEERLHDEW